MVTLKLSLRRMCEMRISALLLDHYSKDLQEQTLHDGTEIYKYLAGPAIKKIAKKIEKFDIPITARQQIKTVISFMCLKTIDWHEFTFHVFKVISPICWTPLGIIDQEKSVQSAMRHSKYWLKHIRYHCTQRLYTENDYRLTDLYVNEIVDDEEEEEEEEEEAVHENGHDDDNINDEIEEPYKVDDLYEDVMKCFYRSYIKNDYSQLFRDCVHCPDLYFFICRLMLRYSYFSTQYLPVKYFWSKMSEAQRKEVTQEMYYDGLYLLRNFDSPCLFFWQLLNNSERANAHPSLLLKVGKAMASSWPWSEHVHEFVENNIHRAPELKHLYSDKELMERAASSIYS